MESDVGPDWLDSFILFVDETRSVQCALDLAQMQKKLGWYFERRSCAVRR